MKRFYPVIHCIDPYEEGGIGHALANTRTAETNGADGVFLIGHNLSHKDLFYIYESVRKQFPDLWIGINFLDVPTSQLQILKPYLQPRGGVNALWFDSLPPLGHGLPTTIDVFGGVAFKYRNSNPTDKELAKECESSAYVVDVVTTSGDKTGEPPSVEKIQRIKKILRKQALLALASGVDRDNIISFLPFVDIFLVATSITERDDTRGNQEYLVPEKVKELANLIHA